MRITVTAPAAGGACAAALRLTPRGRVVVFVVSLLVTMTALMLAVVPSVIATDTAGDAVPVTEVTVQPGDTLWDIASAANPGSDVAATMNEIAQLNTLDEVDDGQLGVGQEIVVPIY